MSKKDKKEEKEIRAVNTDVTAEPDIENAYYNYEMAEKVETKKPGFFKKLFRGKKKVTTSNELNQPQEDDFYQNMNYDEPEPAPEPELEVSDNNNNQQNNVQVNNNNNNYNNNQNNNYNNNNNQNYNQQNNNYNNQSNFNQNNYNQDLNPANGTIDYYYQPPVEEQPEDKPVIPKKIGYAVACCVLLAAVVVVVLNLMSSATEKYSIQVATDSIPLRQYEGYQISFLTNNTTKTTFKSSDEALVTVTEHGYIKAKGYKQNDDGYLKATITVGNANTKTYKKIDVYIIPTNVSTPMEDFTVPSEITVAQKDKAMIEITNITPPNNSRQSFDYISKDTSIAEVSGGGVITGKKKGTTTIEVRNHINKNLSKEIKVTVK